MDGKQKKDRRFIAFVVFGFALALWLVTTFYIAGATSFANAYPERGLDYWIDAALKNPLAFPGPVTGFMTWSGLAGVIIAMVSLTVFMFESREALLTSKFKTDGTAQWYTDKTKWNKAYADPVGTPGKDGRRNAIFTENIRLSMDTSKTRRNLNVLVVGGSGSGKSRFMVKPNLCEMPLNTSFICTDPAGELLETTGQMLEDAGYRIKVFNLVNMRASHQYNPLEYIRSENDVILLTDCILANTTDPNKKGGDDFWEKAQKLMFQAFLFLIWKHGDEMGLAKNLKSMEMLMVGCNIQENQSSSAEMGETARYFDALESAGWYFDDEGFVYGVPPEGSPYEATYHPPLEHPEQDIALMQYHKFMTGAGKTLKSILISAMARLSILDSEEVTRLLSDDDIAIDKVGDEKTAFFIIIPQDNSSFNFLAAMMYTQLFQFLYYHASNECRGNYVVEDALGENVRVFEVAHGPAEDEAWDDDEEESEVVLDAGGEPAEEGGGDGDSGKKRRGLFPGRKKKEKDEAPPMETEVVAPGAAHGDDIDSGAQKQDEDPGEEDEGVRGEAEAFARRAAKAVLVKTKGGRYLVKVPTEEGMSAGARERPALSEAVAEYSDIEFARRKIDAMRKCSVRRLGMMLPNHVRFLLDEFANVGTIPEFDKKIATMRKYEISVTVIIQNMDQIKAMYKDEWGSIVGNCDSFLFLGGQEYDTLEYVSKLLGSGTILADDSSVSHGAKASSSRSIKSKKRELMTPDELRRMDNLECIYILRGENPWKDKKHQYVTHDNYKYTADADASRTYRFKHRRKKKEEQADAAREMIRKASEADPGKHKADLEKARRKREQEQEPGRESRGGVYGTGPKPPARESGREKAMQESRAREEQKARRAARKAEELAGLLSTLSWTEQQDRKAGTEAAWAAGENEARKAAASNRTASGETLATSRRLDAAEMERQAAGAMAASTSADPAQDAMCGFNIKDMASLGGRGISSFAETQKFSA